MPNFLACSIFALLIAVSHGAPNPAVNRIDAPAPKPHFSTPTRSATATSSLSRPHNPLRERSPASNHPDVLEDDVVKDVVFSVPGGTPVTLGVSDVQQLEAAA